MATLAGSRRSVRDLVIASGERSIFPLKSSLPLLSLTMISLSRSMSLSLSLRVSFLTFSVVMVMICPMTSAVTRSPGLGSEFASQ